MTTWRSKNWVSRPPARRPAPRRYGRGRSGGSLFGNRRAGPSWRERRREWHFPWRAILSVLVVGAAAYGFWYLVWSPLFQVKEVIVTGASVETEAAVRSAIDERLAAKSLGFLPQRNALLFSVRAAREAVGGRVYLEHLALRKSLAGRVIVEVSEKEPRAVLATKDGLFVTDADGYVLRSLTEGETVRLGTLPSEMGAATVYDAGTVAVDVRSLSTAAAAPESEEDGEETAIPTITPATLSGLPWPAFRVDEKGDDERRRLPQAEPGVQVVAPAALATVLEASVKVPEKLGTAVRWFTVRPTAETVEALTAAGWTAYFTTARPLGPQVENLDIILKTQVGKRLPDLLYVDLRFGEKIFLNYKETASPPSPSL